MKFAAPIIIVLILITIIGVMFIALGNLQQMTVVYEGNTTKRPIEMALSQFQDSECGMVIDDLAFASQVVAPNGKTWFFHDHGGMAAWLKTKPFQDEAVIWVHALDNGDWIDGRQAWYSRTDETPMLYGFGAYQTNRPGLIDFETMQRYMLRGETIANPAIRKQLIGE
ncbi:MAG: hypothetical protein U9Q77_00585 [Candidatus Marinimicrobia bacterium]|nr:hypothetical protein [Candidatus Neomarinimicrobiota bacterium]